MMVYLNDKTGKYHNSWSHKILIPTDENMAHIAMLDAACVGEERTELQFADRVLVRVAFSNHSVTYCIPGAGTYEGERDC